MSATAPMTVTCRICQQEVLHIGVHLKDHPEWNMDRYQAEFPDAPIMTEAVKNKIMQVQAAKVAQAPVSMEHGASNVAHLPSASHKAAMSQLFELGNAAAARNARGEEVMLTVLGDNAYKDLVPETDRYYIFDINLLKNVAIGMELNIPTLIWGYHGTGKTTLIEQYCSRTNRPAYRVQHTLNMIEADVVGGWRAKDGNTYFDLGPLPLAMIHGWVYIADEYDRAPPGVTSLYQAVLEGKPLVIKEAPPDMRTIKPHPNFRFVATGNTNGAGDETGLYAGTLIGDAANYSRFGITERAPYLPKEAEVALIRAKVAIPQDWAEDLVRWSGLVRDGFDSRKLTSTVGPREILYAATIGLARYDLKLGIRSAITNRWSEGDRQVGEDLMQRIFG